MRFWGAIGTKPLIDIKGQTFGRLTVLEKRGNRRGRALWLCQCSCGNKKLVIGDNLRNGRTKSCGCLHKEGMVEIGHRNKRHGESRTRLYRIWNGMRQRCIGHGNDKYKEKSYHEKGVTVCDEWMSSYVSFRDWALLSGYRDDLSLDRIDNNGNYDPSNCRWTNSIVQSNNKGNNVFFEFNGEQKTAPQWDRHFGFRYGTTLSRARRGWSMERIASTPVRHPNKRGN